MSPAQILGTLGTMVNTGAGNTTTFTVLLGPAQMPKKAVTVYTPCIAAVAPEIDGFCKLLLKKFGPVHW